MSRQGVHSARAGARTAGLRGVVAVVATYTFFLLWAQYGFLDLLRARLGDTGRVRLAMAAMGICGLAASLAAAAALGGRRWRPNAVATDPGSDTPRAPTRTLPPAPAPGSTLAPTRLLTFGFLACAVASTASLVAHGTATLVAAAAAIGAATALVTVPLAADLRRLIPGRRFGLAVGLGTGIAYLVCNLPPLFEATPAVQSIFVAAVCLAAARVVAPNPARRVAAGGPSPNHRRMDEPRPPAEPPLLPRRAYRGAGFAAVVAVLLALVWLDSAAFAVIQETAALKGQSWAGAGHTLTQGAVHLLAAVAAGLAIDAGGLLLLPGAAFLLFLVALPALSGGGVALPFPAIGSLPAAPLYAAGISLYSVALVAYPASRGDEPGLVPRRWRAALLFGVAGWLGSALGVGMAQDLHRIPLAFLIGAATVVLAALVLARGGARLRGGSPAGDAVDDDAADCETAVDAERSAGTAPSVQVARSTKRTAGGRRAATRLVAVPLLFAAAGVGWVTATAEVGRAVTVRAAQPGTPRAAAAAVARGRRIYVGEGCVHCHSQYVRPLAADVEAWGPFRPLDRGQRPPLVGNRRQGPDLSNVGNRRSPAWQRLHLEDPRALVPGSRMPSYAHLFAAGDRRGADLVAYLDSLGSGTGEARWRTISSWPLRPLPAGSAGRGGRLFALYCAACHGAGGRGDGPLAAAVRRPAMDLAKGGFWLVSWQAAEAGGGSAGTAAGPRLDRELARLVRFGLAGSPMPGHEWLTRRQVADLVAFVHTLADGNGTDGDGDDGSAGGGGGDGGGVRRVPAS